MGGGSESSAAALPPLPPVQPVPGTPSTTATSSYASTTTLPPPELGDDTCLEFAGCEGRYPLPYAFGAWPKAYEYGEAFPEGFVWGLGTAAYQVEGGYREGGRGASIWDTFSGADTVGMPGAGCSYCCKQAPCPVNPAMVAVGATGNVACDHYHMVGTDVALMKAMGLRHYRFSIAWPRIYPTGYSADGINREGVAFYNTLIDQLLTAGIEPYVTLYHWDLPQGLLDPPAKRAWWARDERTGAPVQELEEEFLAFAEACFENFGDRVKTWFTFNEPWTFTYLGSGWGKAPCHPQLANWSSDPYVAAHNVLLAHARAVDLYRQKFQLRQGGKIGITLNSDWREPKTASPQDVAACERGMQFSLGWFADPIFGGKGDYPSAMRKFYGARLPRFTKEEAALLDGSADFFALNHYGTQWNAHNPSNPGHDTAYATVSVDGFVHGQSAWLYGAGWGLRKLLNWVSRRYGRPPIYLTEGGWSLAAGSAEEAARDSMRMLYYANYTSEMLKAIRQDGVDVRAYFAWSFMDNFEWERGYEERFGLVYNDYIMGLDHRAPANQLQQPTESMQVRTRKGSSCWLEQVYTENRLLDPGDFKGCVGPQVYAGDFTDPRHPHCIRTVTVDEAGLAGHILGASATRLEGCDGVHDRTWGPVPCRFSGSTIVVDFSPIGGPRHLAGFWNRSALQIQWGDGSYWISLKARLPVRFQLLPAVAG